MFFVVVGSVLVGIAITLAVQVYFIKKYYGNLPKLSVPHKEQVEKFALPKVSPFSFDCFQPGPVRGPGSWGHQ